MLEFAKETGCYDGGLICNDLDNSLPLKEKVN